MLQSESKSLQNHISQNQEILHQREIQKKNIGELIVKLSHEIKVVK